MTLHLGVPVTSVRRERNSALWCVNDERGFHRVVFASNAQHVARCTDALPVGHRALLSGIRYTQHDDPDSFGEGIIHTDADAVFPVEIKQHLLTHHANFIQAHPSPPKQDGRTVRPPQHANTFILSSWYASAKGTSMPRLVTYNPDPARMPRSEAVVGTVVNHWNHPALTAANLASLYLLRFIQGRRGLYYCGSLATPGNGHDLSLLSGLAVARAIGANYPFAHDAVCTSDLDKLAGLMGL
jgi:predicted NAD/FAD-binding protein